MYQSLRYREDGWGTGPWIVALPLLSGLLADDGTVEGAAPEVDVVAPVPFLGVLLGVGGITGLVLAQDLHRHCRRPLGGEWL